MNNEHYRQLLLAKEKELLANLAAAAADSKQDVEPEVQDAVDLAVSSEAKESLLGQRTTEFELLNRVRAALGRIQSGTYGKCLHCGRPITEKRLEAVPWAEFDLEHQAQHDPAEVPHPTM